ncbi:MAG: hypothetical protein Q4D23_07215 [Bacteroidales bacterium]|nr:hypothetical protein [Bacteroidales bacterium]
MSEKILILTDKRDPHPTPVFKLFKEQNVSFFRLNTECLMTDYSFAWYHDGKSAPDFYVKELATGRCIWGHEIISVWYRKPDFPQFLLYQVDEEIDKHNMKECRQFFIYLMYYLSDIYSIGNHFYDKRANSKMIQSKIAYELGMRIAPTCMSNCKDDVVSFSKDFENVGLKCLRNHWAKNNEGLYYDLCTQKVPSHSLAEQPEESFAQTVVFAQEYIEKKYELRVTVMGPHIFTCKLDSQAQTALTGAVDWRQGYDHGLKHEIVETSEEIRTFCQQYLRRLNLNFGCFDFIVTPEDELLFLECNPNGQWGWIEDVCHVPMSEAMADCLLNRLPV